MPVVFILLLNWKLATEADDLCALRLFGVVHTLATEHEIKRHNQDEKHDGAFIHAKVEQPRADAFWFLSSHTLSPSSYGLKTF